MKKVLLALLLFGQAGHCFAASTICKVEKSAIGVKAIAWNDENEAAKITDALGKTFEGRVTFRTKHDQDGEKVNIYIRYQKPYYGQDEAEYIVFPIARDQFRVIGVTYIVREGKRHLSTSSGNHLATCLSM